MKKKKELKQRLDIEAVLRGLAPSKEKAQALIMAGDILVDGQVVYRGDYQVKESQTIEKKEKFPYVSRGALKISEAITGFKIQVEGKRVLDIGISTGGFTDYLLQQGALEVVGVDVNTRQVDQRIRNHSRVRLVEMNARDLAVGEVGIKPDIVTIDVSFISILKILPQLVFFPGAVVLSLVKPQFEARPDQVDKGGIVRDRQTRINVLLHLKEQVETLGYGIMGFVPAGIKGRKGNQEYFFLLQYDKKSTINDRIISDGIKI